MKVYTSICIGIVVIKFLPAIFPLAGSAALASVSRDTDNRPGGKRSVLPIPPPPPPLILLLVLLVPLVIVLLLVLLLLSIHDSDWPNRASSSNRERVRIMIDCRRIYNVICGKIKNI